VHIGWGELAMLAAICVIIFSASKMSALGNALGKFVYSFRKAYKGEGFVDVKPVQKLERVSPGQNSQVVDGQVVDKDKKA
jgi:sec-independent protein translocase protein TatA